MTKAHALLAALPLCAAAAGLSLAGNEAHAAPIELSLEPVSAKLYTGQLIDIDIVVAGLDTEDLSSFDFDLTFDPIVAEYQSYSLGTTLVDPFSVQFDLSDDSNAGSGVLRLAEASGLLDFSTQPDTFLLATVTFLAQQPGISALTLSSIKLFDGDLFDPQPLSADSAGAGSLRVPLPGTLLLMSFGAALLHVRRRRACR
ncbi:cohesin domain-containing protein [uncultured Thiohalocapsa sp.]|uniref:cohesin domain-containing protein n=1 Tax=uncultured Thiohalocapsa sp. TaxID=768990 RepID=UPI0025CBFF82|nr:cohesin domain-containing protein [uncultured Thiohalocapsa sp.]